MKIKIIALGSPISGCASAAERSVPLHKGESRAQVEAKFGRPSEVEHSGATEICTYSPGSAKCSSRSLASFRIKKNTRHLSARGCCDLGNPNHQCTMKRAVLTAFVLTILLEARPPLSLCMTRSIPL